MNTNFSKQMALLGAAVTTFVAGCNKQDELNTSFTETPVIAAPVDRVIITPEVVVLPPLFVIPLVQQDRSYKSRDSITVVSETGKLEISHKSVQPEGRVIASLLDYMTDQLGFETKLTFTAVEGCGNELPANSLTLEISPPKKLFFEGISNEVIAFNAQTSRELVHSFVVAFVHLVRGPEMDAPTYVVPGEDLNQFTQKMLDKMKQKYETGDFSSLIEYEKFVHETTGDYSRTFRSRYDRARVGANATFFGTYASTDARNNLNLSEQQLMRDKATVNYDFDLLKEVYDIIANPKKAARTLPASSTGNPSVTAIQ